MTADADLDRLRKLMADDVSLAHAWHAIHRHHFQGRAAASTIEAFMLGLRGRGVAALKESPVQQRLGSLSPEQLREGIARLIRLRPQYPKIDDEFLLQLEEQLR